MKILPVANINNSTRIPLKANCYISPKSLSTSAIQNALQKNVKDLIEISAVTAGTVFGLDEMLRLNDITYCDADGEMLSIKAGYNNGFYRVKASKDFKGVPVKEYLLNSLKTKEALGGIKNYIEMVKDIKRQDILKRGLKIHTYELNTNVSPQDCENAAAKLSKYTKKHIKPNELFFIENDAFYYDFFEKTAYGINTDTKIRVLDNNSVLVCKFILNEKRNAIGYDCSYWDVYTGKRQNKHYAEQQTPSAELKPIAEPKDVKGLAEAFRFGNTSTSTVISKKINDGIPIVLEHISNRIRVSAPHSEQLQIVRFYDNDRNIQSRICYYDSTIGTSFVYNADGKFMYQLAYNKDHEGNIIACSRI